GGGALTPADVLGLGLAGRDPRHHAPQLGPDDLDRMLPVVLPQLVEALPTGVVLLDPLVGEAAVADLREDALHLGAGLVGDDAGPARHVAVLGGVGDRVAHAGDAVLVHEVDDELHLVQAFEVRRL